MPGGGIGSSLASRHPKWHRQDLLWGRRDQQDQQRLGLQKDPVEEARGGGCSRLSPSKASGWARGSLGGRRDPQRSRILRLGSALRPQNQLTGGPGRPCSPVKPRWPFSPRSPASPVSPLSPRGPWGPWERGRGRVRLGVADPCPKHPGPHVSHTGRASGRSTTHRHASSASRTGGTHGPLCTLRGEKRESKGAGTGVVPRGASTPKHPQPRGRDFGGLGGVGTSPRHHAPVPSPAGICDSEKKSLNGA